MFPVSDQSAATIANLLVREIVCRHGVPSEVLSDWGRAFLLKEVQQLLGYKKINTSAYHPQTDGLVELTSMLAKTVERGGKNWDQQLLFAYCASQQQSTPLYRRDPRLSPLKELELATQISEAWEVARQCAQRRQKVFYNRKSPNFTTWNECFSSSLPTRPVILGSLPDPGRQYSIVSLDRLRRYPLEVPDVCWPPKKSACGRTQKWI